MTDASKMNHWELPTFSAVRPPQLSTNQLPPWGFYQWNLTLKFCLLAGEELNRQIRVCVVNHDNERPLPNWHSYSLIKKTRDDPADLLTASAAILPLRASISGQQCTLVEAVICSVNVTYMRLIYNAWMCVYVYICVFEQHILILIPWDLRDPFLSLEEVFFIYLSFFCKNNSHLYDTLWNPFNSGNKK